MSWTVRDPESYNDPDTERSKALAQQIERIRQAWHSWEGFVVKDHHDQDCIVNKRPHVEDVRCDCGKCESETHKQILYERLRGLIIEPGYAPHTSQNTHAYKKRERGAR